MRIPGRARFGDVIARQLAMFADDHRDLMLRVEQGACRTRTRARARRRSATATTWTWSRRRRRSCWRCATVCETMAARDRMRYEREFSKAAERRLPSLVVRRIYQRAMDPDLDE
jgi:hypothetical protein